MTYAGLRFNACGVLPHSTSANAWTVLHVFLLQFLETIASEESTELLEDGFAEVVSTLVSDYDSGLMPKAQDESFIPEFKKYMKVRRSGCMYAMSSALWPFVERSAVLWKTQETYQPTCLTFSLLQTTGKTLARKGKRLFHPIRLALTGSMSGPDIPLQLDLLISGELTSRKACLYIGRPWTNVIDLIGYSFCSNMNRCTLCTNERQSEDIVSSDLLNNVL